MVVKKHLTRILLDWMNRYRELGNQFPFNVLYPRITAILEDGVIDIDEEKELIELLLAATGGVNDSPEPMVISKPTNLPLNDPMPEIVFDSRVFALTGVFNFGPRREIISNIESKGGIVASAPSKKTSFLIIGEY